ncbi:V-type proton ATPase subunit C-like protein [Tanacetum coccineum]
MHGLCFQFLIETYLHILETLQRLYCTVASCFALWQVRIAEYNNVCSQLVAINRKQTGSLAVCDLSNIVTPNDIVPRSSKNLYEDNEYALYAVTLLKRDADNFRTKARKRGFQIRDIEYNSETQESQKQELENLMQDQESPRSSLLQCCYTSYGESIYVLASNFPYIDSSAIRSLPYSFNDVQNECRFTIYH